MIFPYSFKLALNENIEDHAYLKLLIICNAEKGDHRELESAGEILTLHCLCYFFEEVKKFHSPVYGPQ